MLKNNEDRVNIIRCQCRNVIGVRCQNKVTVTKHGRKLYITLREKQKIEIVCEKCNRVNQIDYE